MKVHRIIRRADSVPAAINGGVTSHHSEVLQTDGSGNDVTSYMTTSTNVLPHRSRPVAERARMYAAAAASKSRQSQSRLVSKAGDCSVSQSHVTIRKGKYLADLFTTVVDMRWRWHVLMASAAFLVTWSGFGVAWFVMAHAHHDIGRTGNDTHMSCIDNVYDFRTALLFSIETQTTIGYGYRVLQRHCSEGILLLMLQSCIGVSIQALVTGLIFSKLVRPKRRAQTVIFSERAVICRRDGEYQLMFRVGDVRRSHIVGTSIRALLVRSRRTDEGELIPLCQHTIRLQMESGRPSMGGATHLDPGITFLVWPITVVHHINSSSPLWHLSAESLMTGPRFEIIVILEGTIESTGMLAQVRTSYLPEEISWAERLSPLLTYVRDNGRYEIDYTQFHGTKPVTMPDCSACQWSESKHLYKVKDRMLSTKQWITDDEDEPDDYSVSFTVQLPDRLTSRSSSGPVWNLFGKNRHSKDSYINTISSTPDNSYSSVITLSHSKQKESANWSVKDDVVVDFSAGGQSTQL